MSQFNLVFNMNGRRKVHEVTNLNVGSEFELEAVSEAGRVVLVSKVREGELPATVVAVGLVMTGGNCLKISLPGKLILSKRKSLWEVPFS